MRLALLTCSDLPEWEQDDRFLHQTLDAQGVTWVGIPWDSEQDWSTFDAVLIRTTWDYVERREEFLSTMRTISNKTRLLNPISIIEWNIRKTYLREMAQAGIPIAPTIWIESSIDVRLEMAANGWKKGFFKPIVGACASDTLRFTFEQELEAQQWLDTQLASGKHFIFQPYLETVETSGEWSTIYFGSTLSHCVQKIPISGDYRVQDDFGASDYVVDSNELPELISISERVMKYLNDRFEDILVTRLDYLLFDGNFVLNEVEMIEPSLFLRHSPNSAPEILIQELRSLIDSEVFDGQIGAKMTSSSETLVNR